MAKIESNNACLICKEKLKFPQNTSELDFVILILQFVKDHDKCEKLLENIKAGQSSSAPEESKKEEIGANVQK